jgi:pimeloyl-ACP methyl ester carboxylesterase
MHVETLGSGPRLVLVHGSVTPGWMTWNAQKPLAERFTLVVPVRSGYPPNPPLEHIDFDVQARELQEVIQPGDHLVAHSYGGVVALLAAPRLPVASLVVIEPPAFGVAADHPAVRAFVEAVAAAPKEPRAYLESFLRLVGSSMRLPEVLPPELEASARATVAERWPNEAVIPLEELAATTFPKLVVSGAHSAAFDAVADVLERRLRAQRAVLPGAGHSVPRLGEPFNALIEEFVRLAPATPASARP